MASYFRAVICLLICISVHAPCVPRKAAILCRDHFQLGDVEAHPDANAIVFAGVAPGSGCIPLATLRLVLPSLKYVDVSAGSGAQCKCLLESEIPCDLKLSGCTRSPLIGKCSAATIAEGGIGLPVGIGIGAVVLILALAAGTLYGFWAMRRRMRKSKEEYARLSMELSTLSDGQTNMLDITNTRRQADRAREISPPRTPIQSPKIARADVHSPPESREMLSVPVSESTPKGVESSPATSRYPLRSAQKKTAI